MSSSRLCLFLCLLVATASPLGAASQSSVAVAAPDPAELVEARSIIEIMFPTAERKQMMDKLLSSISGPMRQSLPQTFREDPGLRKMMEDFLDKAEVEQMALVQRHMPALFDAMASAYTREFTMAELKDIHAFARSPSGGRYLSRSTAIVGDPEVTRVNTAMFTDAQGLATKLMPGFRDQILAYLKSHPDVADKIATQTPPPPSQ